MGLWLPETILVLGEWRPPKLGDYDILRLVDTP